MTNKKQKAIDKLLSYLRILPTSGSSNFPVIYIRVNVKSEGVIFPEWITDQYPDNIISLAIYDLYSDLEIGKDKFTITLSFQLPEGAKDIPVTIPFASIYGFKIDREPPTTIYGREEVDNVVDFSQQVRTMQ